MALLGAGYAVFRPQLASALAPYERGYADTVLRYADRSYEQARWTRLKEVRAIAEMSRVLDHERVRLEHVVGWDEGNFWIVASSLHKCLVVRQREGLWSFVGEIDNAADAQMLRPLDADSAYLASSYVFDGSLWKLDAEGIARLKELDHSSAPHFRGIVHLERDLTFFFASYYSYYRLENGTVATLDPEQEKTAWLHTRDNTPLKEYPVTELQHPRVVAEGSAYAVFTSNFKGNKLGIWENGLWYEVRDLPKNKEAIVDLWLNRTKEGAIVTLVGRNSWVHQSGVAGPGVDRTLAAPPDQSKGSLIKVWGSSPEKFWVMDDSGTVWEQTRTESRVVVRGLRRDDVYFRDAWVSPSGVVLAVTDKHLYRLD